MADPKNIKRLGGGSGGLSFQQLQQIAKNEKANKNRKSNERQQQTRRDISQNRGANDTSTGRGSFGGNIGGKLSGVAFSDSQLTLEIPRKKFTGRCRLYVGNLPSDIKEDELKDLFSPHGDISECYSSGKGFAFLRLDTHAHAESAKEALDGKTIRGRQIRVRFAVHGATIRVKELAPVISNEMLFLTFSAFGEVERAVHIVDEKGRPTGEGIIEFEGKKSAQEALNQIREKVFLMTANSRPLRAEFVEPRDEEDGLSEKMIQKTTALMKERELGPRFAALNSFEYVYGQKWKEIYEMERMRRQELEDEFKMARHRLEGDMEIAYEDYKTQLLREDLQRRQQELERLEAARLTRMQQMSRNSGPTGPYGMNGGQFMDQQIIDGPLGRNPPTFGGAGGRGGIPPLMTGSPSNGMGMHQGGRGGGTGPDVHKLLQTFKDSLQRPHNQPPPQPYFTPIDHGGNVEYNASWDSNKAPPPLQRVPPPPPLPLRSTPNPMELPPEKRMRH